MDQGTQTEQTLKPDYLVDDDFRNNVPEIDDFLNNIDQQVAEFAQKHKIDPMEMRRKVMGKVGFLDLKQTNGAFQLPRENVAESNTWNALVSYLSRNTEGWQFDAPHMQMAGEKFASLSKDIPLRRKVMEHKKVLLEEKMEKKKNKKGKKQLTREEMYDKDVKTLQKYVNYIGNEYNHHFILAGLNGDARNQNMFQRFAYSNSEAGKRAMFVAAERMGCSFYDVLYENVIGKKTDEQVKFTDEQIENMKGAQLLKAFKYFAKRQWNLVAGTDYIPWKELFDETKLEKQIEGCPEEIKVKETDDGKVNLGSIRVDDLKVLVEKFNNNEITFINSSPVKKRRTKK